MSKNLDRVKSADRVFQIMELFQKEKSPLAARNISNKLSMPRSSTNVLIKTMVKRGYLGYDRNEFTYFPTIKIAQLGEWVLEKFVHNQEELVEICNQLNQITQETVSVTIISGDEAQFMKVIDSPQGVALKLYEGSKTSLFHSACGLALLSLQESEKIIKLIKKFNRRIDDKSQKILESEILKRIDKVRNRLVAVDYEGVVKDAGAVSIGLSRDVFGESVAISVSGPAQRIKNKEKQIEKTLKAIVLPYMLK